MGLLDKLFKKKLQQAGAAPWISQWFHATAGCDTHSVGTYEVQIQIDQKTVVLRFPGATKDRDGVYRHGGVIHASIEEAQRG